MKQLDDDTSRSNPKSGVEKILDFMIRGGYLMPVKQIRIKQMGSKAKVAYQITDEFTMMSV